MKFHITKRTNADPDRSDPALELKKSSQVILIRIMLGALLSLRKAFSRPGAAAFGGNATAASLKRMLWNSVTSFMKGFPYYERWKIWIRVRGRCGTGSRPGTGICHRRLRFC